VHRFLDLTLTGVTSGFVYAALALSLVLIWRATRVLNFAQGAMAMFTTYIAVSIVDRGDSYWVALTVALAAGFVIGGLAERVLVRRVEQGPPLNAVILTLGLFVFLEALAPMIWGGQTRSFPTHFSNIGFELGTSRIDLSPFDLFTLGAIVVVMIGLVVLFRYTDVGLRMRAAAFAPDVSRLLGVNAGRMLTLGWALAAMVGALSGVLIAPVVLLSANFMDAVLVFGFTAAILGGLDSPVGAVVGGIGVGLSLTYVGGYVSPDLETVGALVLLIAVLMVRPEGLFASTRRRQV